MNQFILFKTGDNQLLVIGNFPGGATNLNSFFRAYKTSETKQCLPYEWFDHPDKLRNTKLPTSDAFYSRLRCCDLLEAERNDYVNLLKSGMTTAPAVVKLTVSKPPPTGVEKYQYPQNFLKQEKMSSFKDFFASITINMPFSLLKQCKNWKLFTTTNALVCWNLIVPYQTWPTFFTQITFNLSHLTEADEGLLKKIREDIVGGPSIVFTRQAVVDETSVWKSTNICKSIVGIEASQLYHYSVFQPISPKITRLGNLIPSQVDSHLDKTGLAVLKRWSCVILKELHQNVKLKASLQQSIRSKLIASVFMGFVLIATLCMKPWVARTTFIFVTKSAHQSLRRLLNVVLRRESSKKQNESLHNKKASLSLKCGIVSSGDCNRQTEMSRNVSRKTFHTDVQLTLSNY